MQITIEKDAHVNVSPDSLRCFIQCIAGETFDVNKELLFKDKFIVNSLDYITANRLINKLDLKDQLNFGAGICKVLLKNFTVKNFVVESIKDDERIGKKYCNACGHFVDKDHKFCDYCGQDDFFDEPWGT